MKVRGMLEEMAAAGIDMTLVSPRYDVLQRKEELESIAQGHNNVKVVIGELMTHAFPPGAQPESLLSFIKPDEAVAA